MPLEGSGIVVRVVGVQKTIRVGALPAVRWAVMLSIVGGHLDQSRRVHLAQLRQRLVQLAVKLEHQVVPHSLELVVRKRQHFGRRRYGVWRGVVTVGKPYHIRSIQRQQLLH